MKFLLLIALVLLGACDRQDREARYLRQGNALFTAGQYDKARLDYKNALRISPADPEIYYRLGLVDEAQRNVGGAFGYFLQAEQQNEHYQPALLKLASYDLAANHPEEARKRVDILLADTSDLPQTHALNAALLLRQADFTATEREAKAALAADPANITAFSVLTGLYLAQNKPVLAGQTIDAGIAKNPTDLSLLLLKAQLFEQLHNPAKIAEAYQSIFKLQPETVQFRLDLAAIYIQSGDLDNAEATLHAAIAAHP